MDQPIPFIRPDLPSASDLATDLDAMIQRNWFSNFGPFERDFRNKISDFIGDDISVATVNNATTGLMAALAAILPRGTENDSIAIASFTFAAGAQAIHWHGYQPAWIDIDPVTWQPSISSMNELMAKVPNIRGIILTNTFGIANESISSWEQLAATAGIPLIIDSAAGFGSAYADGVRLGTRGTCEVFSFHATKPFSIGEGGAVTSNDPSLIEKIIRFTNFGFQDSLGATAVGLNGKLQELNAAIGIRQLDAFDDVLQKRQAVMEQYLTAFAGMPLSHPTGIAQSSVCFASFACSTPGLTAELSTQLAAAQIESRRYYSPGVAEQPWFKQYPVKISLAHTHDLSSRVVSLPVLANMTSREIEHVISTVQIAVK